MSDLGTIAAFLGGVGAGSVATAIVQHYLARRAHKHDLLQKERSEVYNGLLQALEALETKDSRENAKRFGFWVARAEIVASQELLDAIAVMRATTPHSTERTSSISRKLRAMRADRGVS
jgi:hypothetical protein